MRVFLSSVQLGNVCDGTRQKKSAPSVGSGTDVSDRQEGPYVETCISFFPFMGESNGESRLQPPQGLLSHIAFYQ